MALKLIITSEDDLPESEEIRGLYTQQGDKWVLDVEGAVPKRQLDEFRQSNIDLKKQLEALGDVKPEDAAKAIRRVEELEAQLDKDKNKFDELLEKRTGEMKTAHEKQIEAAQAEQTKLRGQLKDLKINHAVLEAGTELGLRQGAGPDLVSRSRSVFDLDDEGNIVARDGEGELIYNAGGEPLGIRDWVEKTAKEAKHLFDPNQGGGSGGSGGGGKAMGGNNPWKKETWNMTAQGRMLRDNPEMAKRMAAQAGKKI